MNNMKEFDDDILDDSMIYLMIAEILKGKSSLSPSLRPIKGNNTNSLKIKLNMHLISPYIIISLIIYLNIS